MAQLKSYFYCYILGAILSFALPPYNLIIAPFFSFSLFFYLLHQNSHSNWLLGLNFALGYFSFSLYWIFYAFLSLYNSNINYFFIILAIFIVLTFCLFLSCYWASFIALSKYFSYNKVLHLYAFAINLTLAEYLRGHLFTGFAWNLVAYCGFTNAKLMQIAGICNIYYLNFFLILSFSSAALLFDKAKNIFRPSALLTLLFASLIIITQYTYGAMQLKKTPYNNNIKNILLLQPNIPQYKKLNNKYQKENINKILNLLHHYNKAEYKLIILPETAIDCSLEYHPELLKALAASLFNQQYLLIGAPHIELKEKELKIYNSAVLINDKAQILDYSDKLHLVPFGEYIPARPLLLYLSKYFPQFKKYLNQQYSPAINKHSVTLTNQICYIALICYETCFSDELNYQGQRANLIINLTNDAWYGNSIEAYQHLQQAQIRAIEQHLPLLLIANTGITAYIDAQGKIKQSLKLNQSGALIIQ